MSRRSLAAPALLLASLAAQGQAPLHLIPMPREVHPHGDQPLESGVQVVCSGCDADDDFAAGDLRQTLAERGIPTGNGLRIVLQRLAKHPDPNFTAAMQPEGYTISSSPGTLTLTGATAEGVFYAAQTAKQLIARDAKGRLVLHSADIRDWPAMRYRGYSDDLSRGPIDTLAFQKKLVRTLAAYKANIYSPYFEHTQQYASNPVPAPPGGSISAADARELVAYARQFHVFVIPDQEAFGHLHNALVYEQNQDLAETPHGALLSPGQPGSVPLIQREFTELADLYPSPFLHIGADETTDLGNGRTKAAVDQQGLGPVYLNFLQTITTALQPLHRKILFWGDIAENSPELLPALPASFKQNTIAISWHYNEPGPHGFTKYIDDFRNAGFEFWVAPGINNWSRVYPDYNEGLANIQVFTAEGQAAGSTGQLNTTWHDDGETLAANNWYGVLFGAATAWQAGESSIPEFEASYGPVFHGDLTGKLDQAQTELMECHKLLQKQAKVGDGSDGLYWIDPWSPDGAKVAVKLRPVLSELRLHAEKAMQLIAEARAAYPAATNTPPEPRNGNWLTEQLPSNPTTLREPDAIDALELGARRLDFIGMKFQLADEISTAYTHAQSDAASPDKKLRGKVIYDLDDIRHTNGRMEDIMRGYSLQRDLFQQLWLRTNREYGLRPVLEHYDYTIATWYARIDRFHSIQRQWSNNKSLPTNTEAGIPTPAQP